MSARGEYDRRGIPRTGGKDAIIKELLCILEYIARTHKSKLFIDACMGGMKLIGNVDNTLFEEGLIGNDLEPGIAILAEIFGDKEKVTKLHDSMEALLDKITQGEEDAESFFYKARNVMEKYSKNNRKEEYDFKVAFLTLYTTYSQAYSDAKYFDLDKFKERLYQARPHKKFLGYVNVFSKITVMNENCFDLLEKYKGRSDVLFYLDPPYDSNVMARDDHYINNFDDKLHIKLVDVLIDPNFKPKFVLSGWDNNIYKRLTEIRTPRIYKYYIANTIVRSGAKAGYTTPMRTEHIWSNVYIPYTVGSEKIIEAESKLKAQLAKNKDTIAKEKAGILETPETSESKAENEVENDI